MQHFKFENLRIGELENSIFDVTNRLQIEVVLKQNVLTSAVSGVQREAIIFLRRLIPFQYLVTGPSDQKSRTRCLCIRRIKSLTMPKFNNISQLWFHSLFNPVLVQKIENSFDSMWLKFVAFGTYIVAALSSGIMFAFISYEQQFHGHFRTLINQLLSNLYGAVRIYIFLSTVFP